MAYNLFRIGYRDNSTYVKNLKIESFSQMLLSLECQKNLSPDKTNLRAYTRAFTRDTTRDKIPYVHVERYRDSL